MPLVVAGAMVGGFGSGTATAVAAAGIAAQRDPHRTSSLGLLTVSATAGALYLTIPHLGGGHRLPFASIALVALLVWPATAPARRPHGPRGVRLAVTGRLPHRRSGLVLAGGMLVWSMAQNALWGVSSRIGVVQAGLSEVTVGAVFAAALGAGLLGVMGAGVLGARLGRAVPIGLGTVIIAGSIVLSSSARDLGSFATGEILWNTVYPVVLSYLIGLAASLDVRGRWAVLAGSASSVGVACGPLLGSVLSEEAGYPAMGADPGRRHAPGRRARHRRGPAHRWPSAGARLGPPPRRRPGRAAGRHHRQPVRCGAEAGLTGAGRHRTPRTAQAAGAQRDPDGRSGRRARSVERVRLDLGQVARPALLVVVEEGRLEGVAGQRAQLLRGPGRARPVRRRSCRRRTRRSRRGRRS